MSIISIFTRVNNSNTRGTCLTALPPEICLVTALLLMLTTRGLLLRPARTDLSLRSEGRGATCDTCRS